MRPDVAEMLRVFEKPLITPPPRPERRSMPVQSAVRSTLPHPPSLIPKDRIQSARMPPALPSRLTPASADKKLSESGEGAGRKRSHSLLMTHNSLEEKQKCIIDSVYMCSLTYSVENNSLTSEIVDAVPSVSIFSMKLSLSSIITSTS